MPDSLSFFDRIVLEYKESGWPNARYVREPVEDFRGEISEHRHKLIIER